MSSADVEYDPKILRKALDAGPDETTLDAAMRLRERSLSKHAIIANGVEVVGPFLYEKRAREWAEGYIGDKCTWTVVEMTDPEEYEKEVRE